MSAEDRRKSRERSRSKGVPPCPKCGSMLTARKGDNGRGKFEYFSCENPACDVASDFSPYNGRFYTSNKVERLLRREAHSQFDRLWMGHKMTRPQAYRWLAAQLGIERVYRDCHFRHFDEATLNIVIDVVREYRSHRGRGAA